MPTVAELLNPAPTAPQASEAPAPPPGFVAVNDASPAPPPGFVADTGQKPGYFGRIGQALGGAVKQVGADFRDIYQKDNAALSKPEFNPIKAAQQEGASFARYGKTVADIIGIPGAALHAAVSEPVASVLDKIPLQAYSDPSISFKGGFHIEEPRPLSPAEAHQMWARTVDTGLSAIGAPEAKIAAVAERFGPAAAKVVSEAPREVVVTPEGELTPDGREIAAQNGLHPDQVKAAYDHFDEVQAKTSNDNPSLPPAEAPAVAVGDGLTRPPPEEPVTGAPQEQPPAAEAMRAPPPPETPPAATQRLAEAQSEGVALTKGQATQDFTTQEQEQTLRRMAGTEAGAQAQGFYAKQQQQIADAVDRFKSALGNTEATAEERGAQVQDALRTLRDQGKAGVTSLYKQAQEAAQTYGDAGSNLLKLDTAPLLSAMRKLWSDPLIDQGVRQALKEEAARYQLIGHDPTTVEGETTVKLRDNTGQPAGKVSFTGQVEPLTITNAETLRQRINQMWDVDKTKQTQGLKPLIDDAVQQAVERAATEAPGGVGDAFKAARKAHQQQQATFKAKDVVQNLIDWKKGAQGTPVVSPDAVLGKILGPGPDSVTSLKKVRAVLLSSASDESKAAWNAIQAHAVAKVFDKALVLNASAEGPVISGAKLNTAIQAFGVDKLKVLLPKDEFDQLMKLNRIIRNATVPIEGTVNKSGTAYTLMNFLGKQGMKLASVGRFIPGVGPIADVAAHVVKSSQESAKSAKTLRGIREYDLTQAANEDQPKPNAGKFVTDFITTARDPNILAPILAASATTSQKDKRP